MTTSADEAAVLQQLISALNEVDEDAQLRLLRTVATFFNVSDLGVGGRALESAKQGSTRPRGQVEFNFSDHPDMSPKQFLVEKDPQTDVERVTCLAYYLAHYRGQEHFQALDISKLNTEAAQPKFLETSNTLRHATASGYLVPAAKGSRQLSAAGEQFVLALPDRVAAKAVMKRMRPRRARASGVARNKTGKNTKQ